MGKRLVLYALLIVGLAASAFVAGQRARVEVGNRAVELVADYDEVRQIAASAGTSVPEALAKFKLAGVTSIAITEETVQNLLDDHAITPIDENTYSIRAGIAKRVISHLRRVLPQARGAELFNLNSTGNVGLRVRGVSLSSMRPICVGLPEDELNDARSAGLEVIARLVNYPGATPRAIDAELAELKSQGISKVIFAGDQVLGFKGAVKNTAASLRRHGMFFGMVEFAKQKGERTLALKSKGRVIITHSITANEMPGMDIPTIKERFQRAVRERGVKICYVRMYDMAGGDPLQTNVDYAAGIAKSIRAVHYDMKSSHALGEVIAPGWIKAAVGLGVAAGAMMLLLTLVDVSGTALAIWIVLAVVGCAGLAFMGDAGRKAVALLSALVFPTLAALYAIKGTPDQPTPSAHPLPAALRRLAGAAAIAVAGGVLIVGLLSSRAFMLRLDLFAGVKYAQVLPVLLMAILIAGGVAWKSDSWATQKERFKSSLRALASNPILMWQAAGIVILAIIVAYLILRSGNEGMEVSGVELKFRAMLDKLLYVRPRTKEFLFGYPLLLTGIAFAVRGWRRWAAPLIVLGTIGLTSSLNSFCHIHTPLLLTAIRTLNGIVFGTIIGIVLYLIVRNLPGREKSG